MFDVMQAIGSRLQTILSADGGQLFPAPGDRTEAIPALYYRNYPPRLRNPQNPEHILHHGKAHAPPSLVGEAGHVGGDDDSLKVKERVIGSGRFWIVHVQPYPGEVTDSQSIDQRPFVYHCAPGGVDQNPRRLHSTNNVPIDQVVGLGGERCMHGKHVHLCGQLDQILHMCAAPR